MKFLFSVILSLFAFSASCQTWFSEDDYWVYYYFEPFAIEGITQLTVTDKLTINDKESFVLSYKTSAFDASLEDSVFYERQVICYEEMGQVYRLNDSSQFELIYDFNLEKGDSLIYHFNKDENLDCKDSIVYYLDSVAIQSFGNEDLTVQYFSYYDKDHDEYGTNVFIEKIGDLQSVFNPKSNNLCHTDIGFSSLCLYHNGIENTNFNDVSCSEITSIKPVIKNNSYIIYPNPTSAVFTIKNQENISKLNVYQLTGELVKTFEVEKTYSIESVLPGSYILEIIDMEGTRSFTFIIKN